MKMLTLRIRVPADDGVTAEMVRDLLRNQLALNPVSELATGNVDWLKVQVVVHVEAGSR